MLSPTWLSAAKCMTATGECFSKTESTSLLLSRSPCSKGPNLTASCHPVTRLSKVTGVNPDCCNALHAWEPIYPAPPVTKTFCSFTSSLPILATRTYTKQRTTKPSSLMTVRFDPKQAYHSQLYNENSLRYILEHMICKLLPAKCQLLISILIPSDQCYRSRLQVKFASPKS